MTTTTDANPHLDAALVAHKAGLSVVPPREDGSKAPIGEWKPYQSRRADEATIRRWYANGRTGVGVVTGAISRGAEMFETEDAATHAALLERGDAAGLGDLIARIAAGYSESTPGGGTHWYYHLAEALTANVKLARRRKTPEEMQHEGDRWKVLIETKGEGGFSILAPSSGTVHPSGKPYLLLAGGPATMTVLTAAERQDLFALARTFNEPDAVPMSETEHRVRNEGHALRPGDDYAAHTTWPELLEPHGWTRVSVSNGVTYWRRPGKGVGISASTGWAGTDFLYLWSTSTAFEAERGYGKFAAYTVLSHEGDFKAAARELGKQGYGAPLPIAEAVLDEADATTTDGSPELADASPPDAAPLHYTDLGNGERLIRAFGHGLRYCFAQENWLIWDGRRWRRDEGGGIGRLAKRTIRALYGRASQDAAAAAAEEDGAERNRRGDAVRALLGHAKRSEAASRIAAMISLARAERGVAVTSDELDADNWLLSCGNGTLNLKTGELGPHDPRHLITKTTTVDYDADATCPLWLAFLDRIFAGRADLIDFVQRALGYACTGDTSEEVVFFLHGIGRNGKSTMLATVSRALGDLAQHADFNTFLQKRSDGPRNDLARLNGARFVAASEVGDGRRLDEVVIKEISGGDLFTARFLHKEFFDFQPALKLFLACNHRPVITGTDTGIWRRVRLIPFSVVIPDAEEDKGLKEKLKAELPGVLAWLVRGCLSWQAGGLREPPEVVNATAGYRADMDRLGGFLTERCTLAPRLITPAAELYAAYKGYAEGNGEEVLKQKAWGGLLSERGLDRRRDSLTGRYAWVGIGLCPQGGLPDPYPEPSEPSEPRNGVSPKNIFRVSETPILGSDGSDGSAGQPPRVEAEAAEAPSLRAHVRCLAERAGWPALKLAPLADHPRTRGEWEHFIAERGDVDLGVARRALEAHLRAHGGQAD